MLAPPAVVRTVSEIAPETHRPDFVGDGYDPEPLLTAEQVGKILQVPTKTVYDLAIPRVRISDRRLRWQPADVREWIQGRVEHP